MPLTAADSKLAVTYNQLDKTLKKIKAVDPWLPETFKHLTESDDQLTAAHCRQLANEFAHFVLPNYKKIDENVLININRYAFTIMLFRNMLLAKQLAWKKCSSELKILIAGGDTTTINEKYHPLFLQVEHTDWIVHPLPEIFCLTIPEMIAIICKAAPLSKISRPPSRLEENFRDKLVARLSFIKNNRDDINRLLQDTNNYRNLFIYAVEHGVGYFYRPIDIASARDFLSGGANTLTQEIQNVTAATRQEIFDCLKIECSKSIEYLFVHYTQINHPDRLRQELNKNCTLSFRTNSETGAIETEILFFNNYIPEELLPLAREHEELFVAYAHLNNRKHIGFSDFVERRSDYYINNKDEAFDLAQLVPDKSQREEKMEALKIWCDCQNRDDVDLVDLLQNSALYLKTEDCWLLEKRKIVEEFRKLKAPFLENPYTRKPYADSEVSLIGEFVAHHSDFQDSPGLRYAIETAHQRRIKLKNREDLGDLNKSERLIWMDYEFYPLVDFLKQHKDNRMLKSPITKESYSALALRDLIVTINLSPPYLQTANDIYGPNWEQKLQQQHYRAKSKEEPDQYLLTAEDDVFSLAELYKLKQSANDFTNPKTDLPFRAAEKEKILSWVNTNKPRTLARVKEQMVFSDYLLNQQGRLLTDDGLHIIDLNELHQTFYTLAFIENSETQKPFTANEQAAILKSPAFQDNNSEWARKFSLRRQLTNREDFAAVPTNFFMTTDGIGFDADALMAVLQENRDTLGFFIKTVPKWIAHSPQISTDISAVTKANFQFQNAAPVNHTMNKLDALRQIPILIFNEYCVNSFTKDIDPVQARVLPITRADDNIEYHVVNDSDLVEHILAEQNLFLPALSARIPESTILSLKTLAEIPLLDRESIEQLNATEDMLTFYSKIHTIRANTAETLRAIILKDFELSFCKNEYNIKGDKKLAESRLLDAIIIIKEGDKSYAFDIEELIDHLMDNLTLTNPFSRKEFSQQAVEQIIAKSKRPDLIATIGQRRFLKRALASCVNKVPLSTPLDQIVYFVENSSKYAFDINTLVEHFASTKTFTNPVTNTALDDLTLVSLHNRREFQQNATIQKMWQIRVLTGECKNQTLTTNSAIHLTQFTAEQIVIKETDNGKYAYSTQELIDYAISEKKLVFPNSSEQLDANTIALMLKQAAMIKEQNQIHLLNLTKNCRKTAPFTMTNLFITEDKCAVNIRNAYGNLNPVTGEQLSASDQERAIVIRGRLAQLEKCSNFASLVATNRFISTDPLSEVIILDNYAFTADRLVTEFRKHKKLVHPETKQQFSPEQMDAILASPAFIEHINAYPEAKEIIFKLKIHDKNLANEKTLLLENIYKIPTERIFVTESVPHYVFDIENLVDTINTKHKLHNPYTNTEFSVLDCQKLHKFISVRRAVWQMRQQIFAQRNLPADIFAMVKEFVTNMYFNNQDGDKSTAALLTFLDQQNRMPADALAKLHNFFVLDDGALVTFSDIIDNVTGANACAHVTSRMLWRFIYTVNPNAITEMCTGRTLYYPSPIEWKELWDNAQEFPHDYLRAMNMDHRMWEDNPDAIPTKTAQTFFSPVTEKRELNPEFEVASSQQSTPDLTTFTQ